MRRIYSSVLQTTGLVEDPTTRGLVSRILASTTYAVTTIAVLGTVGVDTSPVLAAMGVTGATLGFACKDLGANVVAGLSLAAQRPFAHGTRMSVGTSFQGVVDHWDMRYLYLRGPKNELIHVPNSVIFTSVLTVHDPPDHAFERNEQGIVQSFRRHLHLNPRTDTVNVGEPGKPEAGVDAPPGVTATTNVTKDAEQAMNSTAPLIKVIFWAFVIIVSVVCALMLMGKLHLENIMKESRKVPRRIEYGIDHTVGDVRRRFGRKKLSDAEVAAEIEAAKNKDVTQDSKASP